MCGLTGVLGTEPQDPEELSCVLTRMSSALRHRGPDDSGKWHDERARVGFGFRRLSIQDLSPNGHQPMTSPSGRFTMVFNGEVYNHLQLRERLSARGYSFRGHSDTETICAGIEEWGVRRTVEQCVGMFAIALWDHERRQLSLLRDRLGIKPLYVYSRDGLVLFGSEIKALSAHPGFRSDIDVSALDMYLRYLYIPAPATIYRDVQKVRPGHILTVDGADLSIESAPFWSLMDAYANARANQFSGSDEDAIDELEVLLTDSVNLRKIADVPLGALLSGGVDSSLVVALMQRGAQQPTRTFSIGFSSREHDESVHAARIARQLGTDHTPLQVNGRLALDLVPELPHIYDEPLADPSQIPTLIVSRLARTDVTVALTGDGGDEIFGGYNRYTHGAPMIASWSRVPTRLRRAAAGMLNTMSGPLYPAVAPLLRAGGQRLIRQKLVKLSQMLVQDSSSTMYQSLISAWQGAPRSVLADSGQRSDTLEKALGDLESLPLIDRMMLLDQMYYLPDDLLAKVDRASMATSLEARVPLLDHRVVEFAWRLPAHMKIRDGQGKWLLRQLLYRHVPRAMVDRPKVGFSVPISEWLRGPLRSWAEDLLTTCEEPLARSVVLNAWEGFLRGDDRNVTGVWALVMFEAWRRAWRT